ncbi:hypothetical protein Hanom_Chr12g01065611 [Helianthus anomalus]
MAVEVEVVDLGLIPCMFLMMGFLDFLERELGFYFGMMIIHLGKMIKILINKMLNEKQNDQNAPALQDKIGGCNSKKTRVFAFWTKMATKCKPQGPGCNKFEIWTKVAKLAKPQGPKWQFTLKHILKK